MDNLLKICTLGSGSKGNAFALHSAEYGTLIVDAGFSARQMELKLQTAQINIDSINAVLLTHDHDDHSHGCRVFCNKYDIPLYCSFQTACTKRSVQRFFRAIFKASERLSNPLPALRYGGLETQ